MRNSKSLCTIVQARRTNAHIKAAAISGAIVKQAEMI